VYFEAANKIQKQINSSGYDSEYFYFQGLLSDFYSATNQTDKAIAITTKDLQYLVNTQGEHAIRTLRMLNALVVAQYHAGQYAEAERNSNKGLITLRKRLSQSADPSENIIFENEIPAFVLFKVKSAYQRLREKDTRSIKALLSQLEEAAQVFEKRKATYTEDGISGLLTVHKELTDFIKKLNYELYKLSGDKKYMYTRIRSRMDKQNAIRFAHLPEQIQQEEATIKEQLTTALKGSGSSDENIASYMDAVAQWNVFQQKLKTKYPDYYNMRYGNIGISVEKWCKNIPSDLTVIRYLFAEDELYALVATKHKQVFVSLSAKDISEKITALNAGADKIYTSAHELYNILWQPLEKEISTNRVCIIPDSYLYNLSFETLSPMSVQSMAQYIRHCLLNKYAISYHYSLLTIHADHASAAKMKGNFVAFVPGFSENTKQQYLAIAKNDSLHLDKTYLSLLPLPFTAKLVDNVKSKLGGILYKDHQSTPEIFRSQSAFHQIIHIGTHAEANNDYPEYSRLIFAKDSRDPTIENSLYLYDIYNCDLTSNLSVLTACESGMPQYQNGEGMISMAHAFNYAGAKSMLTALWKIDEQASTIITGYFYANLEKSMPKDIALQQAKLTYLQTADGRMLTPSYWAGLMIMGDLEPIMFENTVNWWYYAIGGATVLLLLGLVLHKLF
jgi:CHAT domain-containing protein